jgi:hypothetical protein
MDSGEDLVKRVLDAREDRKNNAHVPVFALTELILDQVKQSPVTEKEALAALDAAKAILPLLGI